MTGRTRGRPLASAASTIPTDKLLDRALMLFAERGFGALAVTLAQAMQEQAAEADDLVKLRALLVRFVEANTANPALMRIINQEASASGPRFDYLFETYIEPVRIFGDDLLARLAAEGKVRTRSTSAMYFMMTYGAGGPFILPALADKFGAAVDPGDPAAVRAHAEAMATLIFDGALPTLPCKEMATARATGTAAAQPSMHTAA